MKAVYSQLKKIIPDVTENTQKMRDDLTLIGHFASGYIETNGEKIFDLEIRQNRGDALGYYGIAKDLSVYYDIPLSLPKEIISSQSNYALPIEITAKNDVKRIMAIKLSGLKVTESPDWLKKFLALHQINSINMVVDLTNYIMLLYGIPCHAFDTDKTGDNLIWEINSKYQKLTTLDGTQLALTKRNLIISNPEKPIGLSFIGGQNSGIDNNTKDIIVEMAIYNPSRVRQDSRQLRVITEASIRLDKYLDTELIPQAFAHLVKLIRELTGGQIASAVYDKKIQKPEIIKIEFNPEKPALYAGIDIPASEAINILDRLGCDIKTSDSKLFVTPPSIRKDITLEEDLIEEVIRFWGYDKIPLNKPISSTQFPDITPKILYIVESVKNILAGLGYDEVRSWPLIRETSRIEEIENNDILPIYTQNSINSEYPVLRTSMISSLIEQSDQYSRFKLPNQQFFETGKIYHQTKTGEYKELYALGVHRQSSSKLEKNIPKLWETLHIALPEYKIYSNENGAFVEFNLSEILSQVNFEYLKAQNYFEEYAPKDNSAYELTSQIITLDANVSLPKSDDPSKLIQKYMDIIGNKYLWQLVITDIYKEPDTDNYRYTFRASYFNIDDKLAKEIHRKAFNLT